MITSKKSPGKFLVVKVSNIILIKSAVDFRYTAAVYEFYSLHPRRVVCRTFKVSNIINFFFVFLNLWIFLLD